MCPFCAQTIGTQRAQSGNETGVRLEYVKDRNYEPEEVVLSSFC